MQPKSRQNTPLRSKTPSSPKKPKSMPLCKRIEALEEAEDLAAIREYEEQKRNGTLELYSADQVLKELGLR